ncbi:MAG: hypothetical protein RIS45_1749 [Planctomycetota bacterium]
MIQIPASKLRALRTAVEKEKCERSLTHFIRCAWDVLEPGEPYIHNWHIDMIADHLQAITEGHEINGRPYNRLLINIPPGMMKSLLVNVFWPAWEWGPKNMPHLSYLCAAHKVENLSARDSRKMRTLVTSDWYQKHWGDRVVLTRDQNEKLNFQNTKRGQRIATAITSLTGVRADRVIIDDPHSVDSASSETQRESEVTTFLEAVPTRLNNPAKSAIVVIMQRLHEEDVSGVILDRQLGYDHIMLPMRFDPSRAFTTMLGVDDLRDEEGELLFPDRFPEHVVERDSAVMGPYATAGQFQQEPIPRGEGIIQRQWWQVWEDERYPPLDYVIASVDTAYTTKTENDMSAMTVWGIFSQDPVAEAGRTGESYAIERVYKAPHPKVIMLYGWAERLPLHDLVNKISDTAKRFRIDKLLIENKAAGISVAQEIRRLYASADFAVQLMDTGNQDKVARAYSIQHLFSEGLIYAPDRSWADMVINQTTSFPRGKHDDLVDTVTQALRYLRTTGLLQRPDEVNAEIERGMVFEGAGPEPLYPI